MMVVAGVGSSPRPRGARVEAASSRTRRGAHPRVRGEHPTQNHMDHDHLGSSPRPRGALVSCHHDCSRSGLIPASAESTARIPNTVRAAWAHPRVRGEHGIPSVIECRIPGSSPRPRGALPGFQTSCTRSGLIPASAGSTPTWTTTAPIARAHPRVRGEHTDDQYVWSGETGSSPRPRGALGRDVVDESLEGLIPASAGRTSRGPRSARSCRAHPRVRGEHPLWNAIKVGAEGSSPRPRGARGSR